jgi:hypothetical protein
MKKYLDNTIFTFNGVVDGRFFNYVAEDRVKGQILVELSTELDSAEVIHKDLQQNINTYEVFNQRELQDTIEYILGRKVISEDQWGASAEVNNSLEDWDDEIIYP